MDTDKSQFPFAFFPPGVYDYKNNSHGTKSKTVVAGTVPREVTDEIRPELLCRIWYWTGNHGT